MKVELFTLREEIQSVKAKTDLIKYWAECVKLYGSSSSSSTLDNIMKKCEEIENLANNVESFFDNEIDKMMGMKKPSEVEYEENYQEN